MAATSDRRRINAPSSGTSAPVFARTVQEPGYLQSLRPSRTRGPKELRKTCKWSQQSMRAILGVSLCSTGTGGCLEALKLFDPSEVDHWDYREDLANVLTSPANRNCPLRERLRIPRDTQHDLKVTLHLNSTHVEPENHRQHPGSQAPPPFCAFLPQPPPHHNR